MNNEFMNKVKDAFRYLENDYKFRIFNNRKTRWSEMVLYKNSTTAVEITHEIREGRLLILLIRLINNEVPEYPIFIKQDTELNQFYLDDIIALASDGTLENQSKMDLEESIKYYSTALIKYGRNILKGDFKMFIELDKIVKKRAADYEYNKGKTE